MIDYERIAEIGRLKAVIAAKDAEIARLREALNYAVQKYGNPGGPWNVPSDPGTWISIARAALDGKP